MRNRAAFLGRAGAGALASLMVACTGGDPGGGRSPTPGLPWARLEAAQVRESTGPFQARLFDATVVPPGPDVPAPIRGLSGRWRGWMGGEGGSGAVTVATLDGQKATGFYAYAGMSNVNGSLGANRDFALDCTVVDAATLKCDALRAGLVGLHVYLKLRADGALMVLFTANGTSFSRGLMTREP